uniref:Immunoglobulin subtype domain-containing protein n=1 Tax=Lates calcarifer TaxID=8187 RepID=A0A4W6G1W6_LATCA
AQCTLISFLSDLILTCSETDLINAETFIRTEPEGGNMTVACNFKLPGGKKIFCKNECKEDKDILIETVKDRAQSGRYSIEYKEGTLLVSSTLLYVTITRLTKSDSGRYWCGLERTGFLDGYDEIDLRVTDGEFLLKVIEMFLHVSAAVKKLSLFPDSYFFEFYWNRRRRTSNSKLTHKKHFNVEKKTL